MGLLYHGSGALARHSVCQFLQGEDPQIVHAQDHQCAAERNWAVGEDIGLLTAGTADLRAIIEQTRLIAPNFNAIGMPP